MVTNSSSSTVGFLEQEIGVCYNSSRGGFHNVCVWARPNVFVKQPDGMRARITGAHIFSFSREVRTPPSALFGSPATSL